MVIQAKFPKQTTEVTDTQVRLDLRSRTLKNNVIEIQEWNPEAVHFSISYRSKLLALDSLDSYVIKPLKV